MSLGAGNMLIYKMGFLESLVDVYLQMYLLRCSREWLK